MPRCPAVPSVCQVACPTARVAHKLSVLLGDSLHSAGVFHCPTLRACRFGSLPTVQASAPPAGRIPSALQLVAWFATACPDGLTLGVRMLLMLGSRWACRLTSGLRPHVGLCALASCGLTCGPLAYHGRTCGPTLGLRSHLGLEHSAHARWSCACCSYCRRCLRVCGCGRVGGGAEGRLRRWQVRLEGRGWGLALQVCGQYPARVPHRLWVLPPASTAQRPSVPLDLAAIALMLLRELHQVLSPLQMMIEGGSELDRVSNAPT